MLESDRAYDGIFVTAVRTTGIFCRPSCPARKPKPENVEFYATTVAALSAGYRPCQRCKPLDSERTPAWIRPLLQRVDESPETRWTDAALAASGIDPMRVRRWFKEEFGTTFHVYVRARRIGLALERLATGASIDDAALDVGYESLSGFRDAFRRTVGRPPRERYAPKTLLFARLETPLGPMIAMAENQGLVLLEFADRPALPDEMDELRRRHAYTVVPGRNVHLDRLESELHDYFAGTLRQFAVPLIAPGSPFERAIWRMLREVPYGTIQTYGDLARRLDKPRGARAVGWANGRNRIAIVIPCHRVCGSNGELVGYGGGRARKRWLLDHERRIAGTHPQSELWPHMELESA